jgi:hypothetical protein
MGKFVLQKIFFSMENIFLKIEFFSLFGSIKKNIFFIKRLFFNYGFLMIVINKIREIAMCMIKLVAVVILMIIVLMIVIFMIPLMLVVME